MVCVGVCVQSTLSERLPLPLFPSVHSYRDKAFTRAGSNGRNWALELPAILHQNMNKLFLLRNGNVQFYKAPVNCQLLLNITARRRLAKTILQFYEAAALVGDRAQKISWLSG